MKWNNFLFLIMACLNIENGFSDVKFFDVDIDFQPDQIWYNKKLTKEENFKKIISFLNKSETAQKIIYEAKVKAKFLDKKLEEVLDVGEVSVTDTTLVRKFNSRSPAQVSFEQRGMIVLNSHLTNLEAVLDLAHELSHFTFREAFNPYSKDFNLKDFIKSTIEGKGGEVEAYLLECKVYFELNLKSTKSKNYCHTIIDPITQKLSKEIAINEFYKSGEFYEEILSLLKSEHYSKEDFSRLSKESANFLSSAWGTPYTLASIKEYANILKKVCANDKKRLLFFKTDEISDEKNKLFEDLKNRCEKFE